MALTIHDYTFNSGGNAFRVGGQIDFDASYPTGGEAFSIDLIAGRPALELVSIEIPTQGGYAYEYDYTNNLLQVFSTGAQTGTLAATVGVGGTITTLTGVLDSGATTLTSGAVTGTVTSGATTATGGAATASAVDATTPTGSLDSTATTGTLTDLTGVVDTLTTTLDDPAIALDSGTVTFSSQQATIAAAAFAEVANATNLSTLVNVRYVAYVRC